MAEGSRRLAAIMFTDMVGYTALTQSNETQAMDVLDRHNRMLRPFFPRFHGREVKAIGDSFLVEFDSALDALRCATEIQAYLHDYNLSSREGWKIFLRIGIHLGDVIHREGDVFGDAVNIASRIEPLAEPEGVVVSEQVYAQVNNKSELGFSPLGEKALKNVSAPVAAYSVEMPWKGPGGMDLPQETRRIAVLPFVSMSPDPNDEFFADGLTEELIDRLCQVKELAVIARTSVMNYKGKEKSASQIGKELKAGALVEGSIRKAGTKIRVTAQLIRASNEEHMWSSRYDRDLQDIFAVQTDIAENVAGALKLKLVDAGGVSTPSVDVEAYTLFLKGTQLLKEGGNEDHKRARALFEEAIRRDPGFSRAHSGLSQAVANLALFESDFKTNRDRAEAEAKKALELDPESAEGHYALSCAYSMGDRFEEQQAELRTAPVINPGLADAHANLGMYNTMMGNFTEGVELLRKAFSLDPLSLPTGTALAGALRMAGSPEEALELLDRLKGLHPTSPFPLLGAAWCHGQMEEFSKMQEDLDAAFRIDPDNASGKMGRGWLQGETGMKSDAEETLRGFDGAPTSLRLMAEVAIKTGIGDLDGAFEALMKQAEDHSWYTFTTTDPLYKRLQSDARFEEFRRRVGISSSPSPSARA